MRRLLPFLLLASGLAFALPAAAKIEVRATLSPERIGLGDVATLTLEVTNDSLSSFRFNPHFKLDNFALAGEVEQVNDFRYGSSGLKRTFRVFWRLRPQRAGAAAVRQISVEVNGAVLPLTDREVQVMNRPTVLAEGGPDEDPLARLFNQAMEPFRRLREPRQPALFLRQEVEPNGAVVGQQMLYTVYLYARRDVAAMSQDELPKLKGFWVRDIPHGSRVRSDFVEIGGETYARVAVVRKALFPLRPGLFHLTPASFDFAVRVMENNFLGPMIERSEAVHLVTPPTNVVVSPLPAAAPPGFSGAVGRITLAASLEPKQVRVGESATLTLSLGGEGNLHSLDDPRVAEPPGLEISTPQHDGRDGLRGTTVFSDRSWTYSVIPKGEGRFTLQPPNVPYFDPSRGEYRIAAAAPLTLTVLPAEPEAPEPDAGDEKAGAGPGRAERLRQILPWGIAALSTLGALAAVFALLRHRRPRFSGPAEILEAPHPAAGPAATALRQALDLAAGETRSAAFAQRSEAAWRAYFEAACSLPPGTPTSRWGEVLAVARRDAGLRADLEKLLEDLRFLRYAPQLASVGEIRAEAEAAAERLFRRLGVRPGRNP